ncbi:hypothetical protein [Paucibacter sp. M5-1]|uniref:hypothetical protein n=1 Tax=Paucibacter sp. M5-1 TaxID=3015998 RepID=UPI0022B8B681|nr:hypothetical protein [Paucibacter sp. M5-1]MCZ7882923.1 hypothetical protein [Paucibacter sp. M5-1]
MKENAERTRPWNRPWALTLAAALSMNLGGCATITQGVKQNIALRLQTEAGEPVTNVSCELANKLGRWTVQAPGSVEVKRSEGPLMISCESPEWVMAEQLSAESDSSLGKAAGKGAATGAGIGLLAGALATPAIIFTGPMLMLAGASIGAIYGGVAGAVTDGASGAAFEYAPEITVKLKPRPAATVAAR